MNVIRVTPEQIRCQSATGYMFDRKDMYYSTELWVNQDGREYLWCMVYQNADRDEECLIEFYPQTDDVALVFNYDEILPIFQTIKDWNIGTKD